MTTQSTTAFDPSRFDATRMYDRYRVRLRIRERIDGGVPKDPKIIEAWVKSRTGHDDLETAKQVAEHMTAVEKAALLEEAIEDTSQAMWTGFHRDENGWYIETRQVNAMIRESCTMLRKFVEKVGSKQIFQHGIHVFGVFGSSKIYLENVEEMKSEQRAIHVMTAMGPRNAVKKTDYAPAGTELRFMLHVLATSPGEKRRISEDDIVDLLTFAQDNGIGANRSAQSGKFDVIGFEVLSKGTPVSAPPKPKEPKKAKTKA